MIIEARGRGIHTLKICMEEPFWCYQDPPSICQAELVEMELH